MTEKRFLILDDLWLEDPNSEETRRRIRKWFRNIGVYGGITMPEIPEGTPTGGYDGETEQGPEMSSGEKIWILKRIPATVHGGILCHLTCDGKARAMIHLQDEEEFNWLKPRIDGLQPFRNVESPR